MSDLEICDLLLPGQHDVQVTRAERGRKNIHEAARNGEAIVSQDVDARTVLGRETPLHLAVLGSHRRTAYELLREGANVDATNKYGQTPLHYATSCTIVRLLLNHGASATARDAKGDTPLDTALQNGVEASVIRCLTAASKKEFADMRSVDSEREKRRARVIEQRLQRTRDRELAKFAQRTMHDYLKWRTG